ncbi:hypothetical protein BpHYR1_048853 [Brachionus plicatilis]|uniref:Uncharacterized protein n=1 Tax=Brachionus plicatilis TaxID=10195 RepID=A0A3M7SMJ9_BRAPC|nr:hypothetical protein BpHYR1_048853 [Brachionus plicatilis]
MGTIWIRGKNVIRKKTIFSSKYSIENLHGKNFIDKKPLKFALIHKYLLLKNSIKKTEKTGPLLKLFVVTFNFIKAVSSSLSEILIVVSSATFADLTSGFLIILRKKSNKIYCEFFNSFTRYPTPDMNFILNLDVDDTNNINWVIDIMLDKMADGRTANVQNYI